MLDNQGAAKDIREKIEVFLNSELDLIEEYEYHNISEFSLNITEDNRAAKINEFTLDMRLSLNHDECDYDCDDQGKIFLSALIHTRIRMNLHTLTTSVDIEQ
ncbi:hypothetical protein BJAS_P3285 [Bathymodiolus japonicus methanotrophic gill symbiont]|uniref:hypothetical protein n=1 Tax=Bathymodiolus japonicus methanotrophic gill symbiont TaxID=113269 RepID=UPI001B58A851|nr:hypothetical protein [Bathymodiolus japonicus methanotrophic gill symbiont]GFO72786.1 hypothetical protein BJAS_P3285 [Bathymodiolus japonicus methanotrophic gill symbiont]